MKHHSENDVTPVTGKTMAVNTNPIVSAAAEAASGPAGVLTMGGAGSAIGIGAFTANEVGIVGGLLIGIAGFCLQMWLGIRRDKREERESLARIASSSSFGQNQQ